MHSDKYTLFLREYEPNKAFYKAFFVKLVENWQHVHSKYTAFRLVFVNLQRHLQTCLARHKQLATNAISEFWSKEGGQRDQAVDYYELMSIDLNFTDKRLLSDREDGSFGRNSKSLFNLFVLHDPLIHKIILKMQE